MAEPITKDEIKHLILEWGRLHDDHAPASAYKDLVADDGFAMRCGGQEWLGLSGLETHEAMKRQFFDEAHLFNSIELVSASESEAEARSVVTWEASRREDTAPRSIRIKAVIQHTWRFIRSGRTGKPVIQQHIVDKLAYLPGFAPPHGLPSAPHLNPV
jgi:hypothetical protein